VIREEELDTCNETMEVEEGFVFFFDPHRWLSKTWNTVNSKSGRIIVDRYLITLY